MSLPNFSPGTSAARRMIVSTWLRLAVTSHPPCNDGREGRFDRPLDLTLNQHGSASSPTEFVKRLLSGHQCDLALEDNANPAIAELFLFIDQHPESLRIAIRPQGAIVNSLSAPPDVAPAVVHFSIRASTLLNLPILKCRPLDGGRFITLPCIVTKDPDTRERNAGMYRIQI